VPIACAGDEVVAGGKGGVACAARSAADRHTRFTALATFATRIFGSGNIARDALLMVLAAGLLGCRADCVGSLGAHIGVRHAD
jgi:hypothetical protein